MEIFEIGKSYRMIYDDKGYKPIKKEFVVLAIKNNLLKVKIKDTGENEILNVFNLVRAGELENNGEHSS